MNKYLLYKEQDGIVMQIVQCPENEISMYGNKYMICPEVFEFDNSKIQRVIDGVVISTDRTDASYLLSTVNNKYSIAARTIISGVPNDEVSTFPIQKEEAKAWFKDNSESTPFIDGMLISRTDVTKAQLVDKILAKAEAYAYAAGIATGDRQTKEKQILEGK